MAGQKIQSFGFDMPFSAVLVGTSGGIGSALLGKTIACVTANSSDSPNPGQVFAINRQQPTNEPSGVISITADALDEEQLSLAVDTIKARLKQHQLAPIRLIIVAVGALHTAQG
ncbi:MAG: hypothetical protein V7703_09605, partial [Hyphomicrobiales bacterium]